MSSAEEEEEDEEEYVVEAIRGWRFNRLTNCKEFLIKWENYDEDKNNYEPEEHLHCVEILQEFLKTLTPQQLKYYHSKEPHKLNGFQRNSKFVRCVGADLHKFNQARSNRNGNAKKKLYLLAIFEDSINTVEEVTVEEFFEHAPKEAFEFFEKRFVYID